MRINRGKTSIAGIALAGAAALGLTACGGSPTGFHNMRALENSVAHQEIVYNNIAGATAVCVLDTANKAQCDISSTDYPSTTITIVISADGQSWVPAS